MPFLDLIASRCLQVIALLGFLVSVSCKDPPTKGDVPTVRTTSLAGKPLDGSQTVQNPTAVASVKTAIPANTALPNNVLGSNYCTQSYSQYQCQSVSGCYWNGAQCTGSGSQGNGGFCTQSYTQFQCQSVSGCYWNGAQCIGSGSQGNGSYCTQSYTQFQCQSVSGCYWNGAQCIGSGSQGNGGYCTQLYNQLQCQQTSGCFWNGSQCY